jgi:hypothetical protein
LPKVASIITVPEIEYNSVYSVGFDVKGQGLFEVESKRYGVAAPERGPVEREDSTVWFAGNCVVCLLHVPPTND